MFSLSKYIYIEMAHRLPKYTGACKYLHGHSWKLAAHIAASNRHQLANRNKKTELIASGSNEGMLMDFSSLKTIIMKIHSRFDHSTVLWENDPFLKYAEQNNSHQDVFELFGNLIVVPFIPTSENLAKYWAEEIIQPFLPADIQLIQLTLNETCTSETIYIPEARRNATNSKTISHR